jgi:hypothetical protein
MRLDHRGRDVYGVRQVCDSRNASDCDTNIGATLWVAITVNNSASPDDSVKLLGYSQVLVTGKGSAVGAPLLQLFPVLFGVVGKPVRGRHHLLTALRQI